MATVSGRSITAPAPHQRRAKQRPSRAQAGFFILRGLLAAKPETKAGHLPPRAGLCVFGGGGGCGGGWEGALFWFFASLLLPFRTVEGSQRGRNRGSPREISQRKPQPGRALLLSHLGLFFWVMVMVTATTGWQHQGLGHTAGPPQLEAGVRDFCLPVPIAGGRQVLGTATRHEEG